MSILVLIFILLLNIELSAQPAPIVNDDTVLTEEDTDASYILGEGVQLGSLPFYIGGYFSFDYVKRNNSKSYRLNDLTLLGYGNYSDFSYLLEAGFENLYGKTFSDNGDYITKDTNLYLKRIYTDYNYNENFRLRLGKYNSPIGYWNLLPINVLRESNSNPISSRVIYPEFTTGIDLNYASYIDGAIDLNFMFQHNDSINSTYNNYRIDQHVGAGLNYELNNLSVKVNGGYFHLDNYLDKNNDYYYSLLSAKYEGNDYQVIAEFGNQLKNSSTTNNAGFIQGIYYFTEQHIGILRAERFENKTFNIKDNIAIFGYTYRPISPIALKAEYQRHTDNDENQLTFSLSVLF